MNWKDRKRIYYQRKEIEKKRSKGASITPASIDHDSRLSFLLTVLFFPVFHTKNKREWKKKIRWSQRRGKREKIREAKRNSKDVFFDLLLHHLYRVLPSLSCHPLSLLCPHLPASSSLISPYILLSSVRFCLSFSLLSLSPLFSHLVVVADDDAREGGGWRDRSDWRWRIAESSGWSSRREKRRDRKRERKRWIMKRQEKKARMRRSQEKHQNRTWHRMKHQHRF